MDVYTNKTPTDFTDQLALARKLRIEKNMQKCCAHSSYFKKFKEK
jgi:hypothetical protein